MTADIIEDSSRWSIIYASSVLQSQILMQVHHSCYLTWPDLTSNGSSYHGDFSNNMLQLMMAYAYRISCSYRSSEELNAKSPSPPEKWLNWWRTLSASLAYRLRLRVDHDRGDVTQGGGGRFHMLKQELIYFFLQSCLGLHQFGIGWITHLI